MGRNNFNSSSIFALVPSIRGMEMKFKAAREQCKAQRIQPIQLRHSLFVPAT